MAKQQCSDGGFTAFLIYLVIVYLFTLAIFL